MFPPLEAGLLPKAGTCWEAEAEWKDIWPSFPFGWGSPLGEWDWGGHLGKVFPGSGFLLAREG